MLVHQIGHGALNPALRKTDPPNVSIWIWLNGDLAVKSRAR